MSQSARKNQQKQMIMKGALSDSSVLAAAPVPMNPPIAAIFDVDGTLLIGESMERRFLKYLWRYGELRVRDLVRLAFGIFRTAVEGRSIFRANKAYLSGKNLDHLRRLAGDFFDQQIKHRLLPQAIERVRWHQQQGHRLILVSGTLDLLLEPLAEYLNACSRIGTQIETNKNSFSGKIVGEHPYDRAKVTTLMALNKKQNFNLAKSFAYGNHYTDRHLLSLVGNPVATNPDHRLRNLATKQGWIIEEFVD